MNEKPTYEELAARIHALEKAAVNHRSSHEEERYRNVYNTAPLAFVIWDTDCKIIDWNKQSENIFGWSKEEVLGRNFFDFLIPENVRPQVGEIVNALLGGKIERLGINENYTKSGKVVLCKWNNSILYDDDGQVRGAMSLALDITAQRHAQEQLRESSEKIKLFAYSIAHDLKKPSLVLHSLTKKLQGKCKDSFGEVESAYCNQIVRSAEQIATLVEMINLYITTKETPLCIEEVNPKEIITVIREEFSAQLTVRQIELVEPEYIPDIRGDHLAILRVFRNLVDNALKYGGEKLRKIGICYRASNNSHIFSIFDDGIGLNYEESEGIFGLFKRKENSRGIEGAGLGLAIVKEIAERHRGNVWAEPGAEKGIIFNISISKFIS